MTITIQQVIGTQVEVFKTNVEKEEEAMTLARALSKRFPYLDFHFDLEDCDRILRVEGVCICPEQVMGLLVEEGYECQVLDV